MRSQKLVTMYNKEGYCVKKKIARYEEPGLALFGRFSKLLPARSLDIQ